MALQIHANNRKFKTYIYNQKTFIKEIQIDYQLQKNAADPKEPRESIFRRHQGGL
jgi:hypothetical protein